MFDDLGVATAIRCDDGRPCHASLDERVREAFVERIEYVHIRILHRRERLRMTERPRKCVVAAERIFCARFKRLPLGTIADNCDREFLPFLSHETDGIDEFPIALPWHEASDRYHERPWKCPQSLHDCPHRGEFDRIVDDVYFRALDSPRFDDTFQEGARNDDALCGERNFLLEKAKETQGKRHILLAHEYLERRGHSVFLHPLLPRKVADNLDRERLTSEPRGKERRYADRYRIERVDEIHTPSGKKHPYT